MSQLDSHRPQPCSQQGSGSQKADAGKMVGGACLGLRELTNQEGLGF